MPSAFCRMPQTMLSVSAYGHGDCGYAVWGMASLWMPMDQSLSEQIKCDVSLILPMSHKCCMMRTLALPPCTSWTSGRIEQSLLRDIAP